MRLPAAATKQELQSLAIAEKPKPIWSMTFTPNGQTQEERGLEARFGEVYREYKRRVPRWLGLPRR
jgi:hypothetical protein